MALPPQYRIGLDFGSPGKLSALDLSSLLWDLNRIYVVGYRLAVRSGEGGQYSNRRNYSLPEEVQLSIARIRFESPLMIQLISQVGPMAVGTSAGIWALIQAIDKVMLLGPTSRKMRAEAAKAELEVGRTKLDIARLQMEVERMRREMYGDDPRVVELIEQSRQINSAVRQLRENSLQPIKMDIHPSLADRF